METGVHVPTRSLAVVCEVASSLGKIAKKASETPPRLPRMEIRPPTIQTVNRAGRTNGGRRWLILALILGLSFLTSLVFYTLFQPSEGTNQARLPESESLAKQQQPPAKDPELRALHERVDKLSAGLPLLSKELDQLNQKAKTLHDLIDQLNSSGPQLSKELDQFERQSQKVRELINTFQTSTENPAVPREPKTPANAEDVGNGGANTQNNP
jgi:small-conductance mechanosensitive channel